MKKQLILAVALLGSVSAFAQPQGRYDDRNNSGFGRGYGRGGDFGRDSYRRPYDPVRASLDTLFAIQSRARVDRHEANHIRQAVEELTEFADRRQRGRFDRNSLNDAIEHMRDLARADQLHPRDRSLIAASLRDLYRLREVGDFRDDRRF